MALADERVLLTSTDIQNWERERREIEQEIAELEGRSAFLQRKLEAALVILRKGIWEEASDAVLDESVGRPMTEIVIDQFQPGERLKTGDVIGRVASLGGNASIPRGERGNIYTALSRLTSRDRLVRYSDGSYALAPPNLATN